MGFAMENNNIMIKTQPTETIQAEVVIFQATGLLRSMYIFGDSYPDMRNRTLSYQKSSQPERQVGDEYASTGLHRLLHAASTFFFTLVDARFRRKRDGKGKDCR